ncbi:large ribosomal subunit protein eL20z-like isoform X2 [Magnolia sinica]|uniref:large ribosomal subunit protein eL20z-like isoform X2 n=1 Tax=Magnolia sinica TaxID=86752 RepID=UPI00265B5953|nr:large ribosomal subunit protein eL20z-like isoform X2 [Magnolia sinica]
MPQEDPTKIPVHQPLYGTFSPVYPHSASIQSTPAFPPPGLSTPPPPSFYQNPQTYHAIPGNRAIRPHIGGEVGYQTYGAVVEGIPVRRPRLPCCGMGIGWFLFLTGFFFAAVPWYVGAFILLFVVVDYREKAGLIACTIGLLPKAMREMISPVRFWSSGQTSNSQDPWGPTNSPHRWINSLQLVENAGLIACNIGRYR